MNDHQANELLDCPFCGAPAQEKRNRTVMVACTKCTAATFQELSDPSTAIAAWNRRAAPTSEPAVDRDAVPVGYVNLETGDFAFGFYQDKIPPNYFAVTLAAPAAPAVPEPCTYPSCDCDQDHACGPVAVPAAPLVASKAGWVVKAAFGSHKILVGTVDLADVEVGTPVYFAPPSPSVDQAKRLVGGDWSWPGAWNVLTGDCKPDATRLLDIIQTNGVMFEKAAYSRIDWTQVADWRYSSDRASTGSATSTADGEGA